MDGTCEVDSFRVLDNIAMYLWLDYFNWLITPIGSFVVEMSLFISRQLGLIFMAVQ